MKIIKTARYKDVRGINLFSSLSLKEKEKIEDYSKPMTTEKWKKDYSNGGDLHWMEGEEPSPLAKEMIKDLKNKKNADILEIGCANGRDSIFMAEEGHNITGIDVAPEAIRVAKKKAKKIKNVIFEVGDAEELKYKDKSFDAVYSVAALGFSLLQPALREIYRVLRPNGIAKLFLYTRMKTGEKWVYGWSPEDIKKIVKEENFKIKKFKERHRTDDPIKIPGVKGKVKQENYFVITTLEKK